jgi:hypothetical protein
MPNPAKPFLQVNRIKRHPGQSRVIWDTPFSFSNPLFLADLKSQLELGSETGNVEFNIGEFSDWDEIRDVDVTEFPTGTVMSASGPAGTFYYRWLLVPGGAPPENVPTVVVPTVPDGKYWKLISYHNVNDTETTGLLIPGGFVDLLGTGGVGGLLLNVTNITFVGAATALALPNDSTANTQAPGNNTTRIATTAFVSTALANLVASSPAALDTLNELAAALGNDANFAATTATALGNRVRVDTAAQGLDSTQRSNARANIDVAQKGLYTLVAGSFNAQSGTTYTVLASDDGKVITLTNAAAITVTVPAGLGAEFSCVFIQGGAGQVTFSASGTTVNNVYGLNKIVGQHGRASLIATASNVLNLSGDLA